MFFNKTRNISKVFKQFTKLLISSRMLPNLLGPKFPQLRIDDMDAVLVPSEMNYETVTQSWYRFLHSIGNPVDLSKPEMISQTQAFYQYAIVAKNVIDPTHHPCLEALPDIFLRSMQSVSNMVDAFVGIANRPRPYQKVTKNDASSDFYLIIGESNT